MGYNKYGGDAGTMGQQLQLSREERLSRAHELITDCLRLVVGGYCDIEDQLLKVLALLEEETTLDRRGDSVPTPTATDDE